MEFGICIPHYGRPMDGPALRDVVQAAESLGYDSVWTSDHIVVPAAMDIVYRDGILESLNVLAYAAALTRRVRLGISTLIIPYRNPIVVAKELATIDVLSGGRTILGVAAGWMEGEFAALGAPYHDRGRYTDEALRIIKELWTSPHPSFEGRYYRFSDITFAPRPLQQPHPPIWVGGKSRAAMRRAVALGDAWHLPTRLTAEDLGTAAAQLRQASAAAGRGQPCLLTARVRLGLDSDAGPWRDGADYGAGGRGAVVRGGPEQALEVMRRYAEAGVSHVAMDLEAADLAGTLRSMERFAGEVASKLKKQEA